jgi:hypothetical protein
MVEHVLRTMEHEYELYHIFQYPIDPEHVREQSQTTGYRKCRTINKKCTND